MRIPAILTLALVLAACSKDGELELVPTAPETRWRMITTEQDRDRLRNWRKVWTAALPEARAADGAAITAGGALFEPDQAMTRAMPPAGDYKCRIFKLGGQRPEQRDFSVLPTVACRIGRVDEMPTFAVFEGAQRPSGKLYAESDARVIFLGALELGDETTPLGYGKDAKRDMAGYVERVGVNRWRLVLPTPAFESQLDVIELVPG
ncbi:DUF4893 domain-containing protein [Sphingomonas sp. LT1P40]|uniref:DUF4893 domain-containing protein n=1 Tax=Alteristakelama amylovorans TaxID=3096166 RepID=UPI002FCA4D42